MSGDDTAADIRTEEAAQTRVSVGRGMTLRDNCCSSSLSVKNTREHFVIAVRVKAGGGNLQSGVVLLCRPQTRLIWINPISI